jgi:acetyl esterase/lipase
MLAGTRAMSYSAGGQATTKVGVAGDSAGGLIAASVCHTLRSLEFQVRRIALACQRSLVYPLVDRFSSTVRLISPLEQNRTRSSPSPNTS